MSFMGRIPSTFPRKTKKSQRLRRTHMKFTLKLLTLVALATTALVTRSFAVDYDFSNGDANNVWVDGNNWTPAGGPPTAADNARVGTTAFATETANLSGTDAGTANNVRIGLDTGTDGTVNMSNHSTLDVGNNVSVGDSGTGTLNLFDHSIVTVQSNMTIGNHVGSVGSVILSNNAVLNIAGGLPNGSLIVGDQGTGTLEIHNNAIVGTSGGEAPENLFIGRQAGGVGTVLVNSGTLNVDDAIWIGGNDVGPGGQGELRIVNGGTVTDGGTLTVWGPGSGQRGTLSVDSTYALDVTGTLTFVGGQLNFLGDGVNFTNNATLTNAPGPDQNGMFANVGNGNTATISGELIGNGDLTKTGTGTLILTNNGNDYRDTNINNGTLVMGNTFVTGFRDTNVNTGGTLRTPEGMPTSFSINRDLNVNGGTYFTQVGGTISGVNSDLVTTLTGNINLDPANSLLFVHRINGYNPNNGDVVTVMTALGTLNGQFSNAPQFGTGGPAPNDFLGLIQPFADYGNINANSVDLVFGFAATFASVAKTPNQIATAEALDAAVAAGCIVNATNVLGNVPINTLRHAYDLIAPEELASMYEASFAQGMVQSLNLQHRMDDVRWGSTGFCADGFVIQDNHGYTKNDGKSVADKNPVEETPPPDYRWGSFITGTGELTKVGDEDANGDHHGYQLNNASFTMGVDYRVTDHWAIGLSGGYSHTTGELVDDGRMNTDGGRMGLYTTWYSGGFYVDAAASGGWNQYDTRRTAYLGTEQGSTDGAEFDGMVAAGYDWKKGCWIFGPYADFEYSYVEFNSFTEGDTSLIPLHYPDQNQNAYRSNLGLRIAHEQVMKPGEGLTVVPEVRAAWRHDFGDTSYAVDSNFVGCDDTFTVHGPYIGRDSAVVDIGLTAYCTQQLSASIFYQGQFGRDNYNNNAISGGMRFAF